MNLEFKFGGLDLDIYYMNDSPKREEDLWTLYY